MEKEPIKPVEDIRNEEAGYERHLPEGFAEKFPLVFGKISNDPVAFLNMIDFMKNTGGKTAYYMESFTEGLNDIAHIAEFIINQHEVNGEDYIVIPATPRGKSLTPDSWPEVLAFYTQNEVMDLRNILFPGLQKSGHTDDFKKCYFDWRKE